MQGRHHEEVKHPNLIYTAARDAAQVVGHIAQRLG